MSRPFRVSCLPFLICAVGLALASIPHLSIVSAANTATSPPQPPPAAASTPSSPEEKTSLEVRRQQLIAREAALAAREQELKRLSDDLDGKIRKLTELKKSLEEYTRQKKTSDEARKERYRKMIRVYKGLKPADAGGLINALEEDLAIELLKEMDQKLLVKLIPHLSKPRVIKWTRQTLKGE